MACSAAMYFSRFSSTKDVIGSCNLAATVLPFSTLSLQIQRGLTMFHDVFTSNGVVSSLSQPPRTWVKTCAYQPTSTYRGRFASGDLVQCEMKMMKWWKCRLKNEMANLANGLLDFLTSSRQLSSSNLLSDVPERDSGAMLFFVFPRYIDCFKTTVSPAKNPPACRRVWLEGVVLVSVLGLYVFHCSLAARFCFVWTKSTPPPLLPPFPPHTTTTATATATTTPTTTPTTTTPTPTPTPTPTGRTEGCPGMVVWTSVGGSFLCASAVFYDSGTCVS